MNKVLIQAAEIIDRGWTQRTNARDANGNSVNPLDNDAKQFCAWGAMCRADFEIGDLTAESGTFEIGAFRRACDTLRDFVGNITAWNDAIDQTAENVAATLRELAYAKIKN